MGANHWLSSNVLTTGLAHVSAPQRAHSRSRSTRAQQPRATCRPPRPPASARASSRRPRARIARRALRWSSARLPPPPAGTPPPPAPPAPPRGGPCLGQVRGKSFHSGDVTSTDPPSHGGHGTKEKTGCVREDTWQGGKQGERTSGRSKGAGVRAGGERGASGRDAGGSGRRAAAHGAAGSGAAPWPSQCRISSRS